MGWICLVPYLLFIILLFISGFRLIKRKEFVSSRRQGLFRVEKYRVRGDKAVWLGKSYIAGAALITLSSVSGVVLALITQSRDCAGIVSVFLCLSGGMVIIWPNVLIDLRLEVEGEKLQNNDRSG
jgi:membrane protein CcdC involved in cytochrome C biogenesis